MMNRLERTGVEGLRAHLDATYGVRVAQIDELDLGVFRVEPADGPRWVARLFPAERPHEQALGDAEILRALAGLDYPAERCAAAEPVSVLEGQSVLVTELVPGVPRTERREAIRAAGGLAALGYLLGRLHSLPADTPALLRPGGAWHHLADGTPTDEIAALTALLAEARRPTGASAGGLYDRLVTEVGGLDDGAGLPESFVHPDFVLRNVIAPPTGGLVVVDWTGAGRAPRLCSLAFLLWSVAFGGDLRRIDRAVAGYRRHITPEEPELERLEALLRVRPIVFDTWSFSTGRRTLAQATASISATREAAAAIAARARTAFAA